MKEHELLQPFLDDWIHAVEAKASPEWALALEQSLQGKADSTLAALRALDTPRGANELEFSQGPIRASLTQSRQVYVPALRYAHALRSQIIQGSATPAVEVLARHVLCHLLGLSQTPRKPKLWDSGLLRKEATNCHEATAALLVDEFFPPNPLGDGMNARAWLSNHYGLKALALQRRKAALLARLLKEVVLSEEETALLGAALR